MSSKIKKAEEFVYSAVTAGEMEIDTDGRIWRVATANQTAERNPFAKVTTEQVIEIRAARAQGEPCAAIAAL